MIFRTVHNSQNPYFQMNKASVDDERLSYKAVGIHAYLMSKPDNWLANEVDLTKRHDDGKAAVRAGVQELIEYGYMTRVQMRKENKIIGWRLDTYETPQLNPNHKEGDQPEFITIDLDSENQNVGELDSDFQDVGKQDVGKQDVGNRNTNKERVLVSNDVNKNETNKTTVVVADVSASSRRAAAKEADPLEGWRDVVSAYESNIGMFTAMSSDMVKEAVSEHGSVQVVDAIKEAVKNNVLKWSYVEGILKRWHANGKTAKTISPKAQKDNLPEWVLQDLTMYEGGKFWKNTKTGERKPYVNP